MSIFKSSNQESIVFLLLIFTYFSLILLPMDINSKIIILLGVFSIVSAIIIRTKKIISRLKIFAPFFLLFFYQIISLLYTDNLNSGLKEIRISLPMIIFPLIFSLINLSKNTILRVLKWYPFIILISCLYSHLITINHFLSNGENNISNIFNLNYSYSALADILNLHTTYFSLFILFAIIIIIKDISKKSTLIKTLNIILISYFSLFILMLSSRTSIIVLYSILIYNIFLYLKENKKIIYGIVYLIGFHIILLFTVSQISITKYRFQHIFGFTYYTGYTVNDKDHKLKLWNASLEANENFFIGNGIGDIQNTQLKIYKKNNLIKPLSKKYNAHNQYLEYYVGLGIFGVLIFILILLYYFSLFFQTKNLLGLQLIFIISCISITECIWSRHHGMVFIALSLSLLISLSKIKLTDN